MPTSTETNRSSPIQTPRPIFGHGWRLPLSLRVKLLIAIAFILVPSIILILVADVRDIQERRRDVLAANLDAAESMARLVDASFDNAIGVGLSLAHSPTVQTLDPTVLDPYVQGLAPVYPQYRNIVVVNQEGLSVGEMLPYAPNEPRLNVGDRPYFQEAMREDKVVVSNIIVARRVGVPTTIITVPIHRSSGGPPIGAVLININLEYFQSHLWATPVSDGRVVFITDTIGGVAFASHLHPPTTQITNISNAPLIHVALEGKTAYQTQGGFPSLDGSQLGAATPTPRYRWVVAVLQPVSTAYAALNQTILIDVISLALAIGLGIFAAFFVSEQIVGPILSVDQAARAWQRGQLNERLDIRTGDELERLGNSLNAMAASLSQILEQLSEADRRLLRERNRLRTIFETSPIGIIVVDADGNIVMANPTADALVGRRLDGSSPHPVHLTELHLYHTDGTPYAYEDIPSIRALHEGQETVGLEVVVRRANGWQIHLLVNSAPIRQPGGQITGSVTVFLDITPFIEEERLRSEFVESAAHEFRGPLTVIKGYAEVAMRDPTVQGTRVCHELSMIVEAADRASHLADELLTSAKLHLPPLLLHYETVDLASLVREAVTEREAKLSKSKYHFSVETMPATVEGDPTLLKEALTDVIEQAETAMPSGGEIRIRLITWDGVCTVSVTDHGSVVPSEHLGLLFQPFTIPSAQTGAAIPNRSTLPLYLAKRIIQESGGWMRAESSEKGTTISFTLPRRFPEPDNQLEPSASSNQPHTQSAP